ncbi:MAG: pilus (MSHA type) biogenesis protein MshL [Campylobacterales bacterium]|nr:pilus (MSHA type) biogenesis protein MshL [Campylobacterales bacterium]
MLLSHLNSKLLAVGTLFILLSFPSASFGATEQSCEFRVFNVRINESVSIREVINQLSSVCSFSTIVRDPQATLLLETSLQGINIKDLTLHEILDLLLEENNLNYEFKRNVLRISALQTKTFTLDYITSVRQGVATLNASISATPTEEGSTRDTANATENEIRVTEEFDFWKTLDVEITSILNSGSEAYAAQSPIINHKAGLITITGTARQIERIQTYLDDLKRRLHRQVMIDVSVISVSLSEKQTTGIDWSKFQLSLSHNSDNDLNYVGTSVSNAFNSNNYAKNINILNNISFSMEGLINFLKSNGDTRVVSSPKVITMNNQQALITVGDNINYRVPEDTSASDGDNITTTYNNYSIFIGVLLNLLPEISDENKIMLRINPSISSFKYSDDDTKQTVPREVAPDTTEKKLSTVVMVNNGDTIILGGLIENSKGFDHTKVPLLGDLPLLGSAFRSTKDNVTSTELVFVITPRIIGEDVPYTQTLKDLGFSKSLYE